MDDLSDTTIRANLRSVLAESGIDPNKTSFVCTRGVVRLLGDVAGIHQSQVKPQQIDNLEQSIRRTKGVQRVHFHPQNWERLPNGQWKPIEKRRHMLRGEGQIADED